MLAAPMRTYRLRPELLDEKLAELRRKQARRLLGIAVLAAGGVTLALRSATRASAPHIADVPVSGWLDAALFLVLAGVIMWRTLSAPARCAREWSTFVLEVDGEGMTRRIDRRSERLLRTEVARLRDSAAHGLLVHRPGGAAAFAVPRALEGFEEVRAQLEVWQAKSRPQRLGRTGRLMLGVGAAALAFLALSAAYAATRNDWFVRLVPAVPVGLLLLVAFELGAVPTRTLRRAVLLGAGIAVALQLLFPLLDR